MHYPRRYNDGGKDIRIMDSTPISGLRYLEELAVNA